MRQLSTALKISLALALLSTSILVLAELIGIVPNESIGLLEGRKKFSESLAIQVSAAAAHNEIKFIEKTLDTVVQRNTDVLSAVLIGHDNRILASAGNHEFHWSKVPFKKSTPTHVQVPILKLDEIWGTLQITFSPLEQKKTFLAFFDSFIGLVVFVGLCGFLLFCLFIKKVLRELDPGAVVPERVKAAFNALAEGLVILDEKQQIVLANDTFAEKMHKSPDKLIGRKASTLRWANQGTGQQTDYPWQLCLRQKKIQTGRPLRFKAPDGERTFMVNATPVLDAKGIIRGVLATFDDVTDLDKKHETLKLALSKLRQSKDELRDKTLELEFLANRDPLSGCLNRRAFLEKYETVFFDASETKSSVACIMADIDHFKSINDRYGHLAGDKVIQLIAETLRSSSRSQDLVGRYGGEEFCLILPDTDIEECFALAERFRKAVLNDHPISLTSMKRVTISVGVAELCEDIAEPADLINRADIALYEAKRNGRNQVVRWDPQLSNDNDNGSEADDVQASSDGAQRESPVNDEEQDTSAAASLRQRVSELETELEHYREVLEQKSGLDKLTGLPNRLLFIDRINQALARSKRQNQIAALVSLDIDAFKRVNDALGHLAGDQLLKRVAERIATVLRSVDTVAVLGSEGDHSTISRLSNDEFGVLITDLPSVEPVTWIVKRILNSTTERLVIDDHEILVTCSAGVSLFPHDGEDAENLLRNAGAARSAAKRRFGRNNVRFFSSDLNKASYRQLWLEGQLSRALENKELALRYQPKIDLKSGKVKAMEALVRWRHPKLGLISPKDFIPTAEHTGLIDGVSDWVMRSACEQTRQWIERGFSDLRVAVNLSNIQLRDKDLAQDILSVLDQTGLPPSHLELEITETTMMENFSVALATIKRLHDAGVHFAIDDFGTGYSSLSCLKILPVNSVKVDRSFLSETFPLEQDQLIIGAIISMSHSMGLRVVAEGVETQAQLGLLRNMGCDEIQGYLFSKPLSAEKATRFLLQHAPNEISSAA